jgi:FSR family fosmidomycin resistance protein-like MFS transporter
MAGRKRNLKIDTTTAASQSVNVKIILALTMIHFVGDFYNSFVIPLLPVFITKFSLSLAQAGIITGFARFLAFVVQPPVGYLADRYRTRLFTLGGPLLVIVFISLTGVAPYFWTLVLFVCLGSIGSSMFHPTTAGMVEPYAGRHFGLVMAIFGTGGTISFGVGPLFISWFVGNYGLQATPYAMIIGLTLMLYLFIVVPLPEKRAIHHNGLLGSIQEVFGPVWIPILMIWLVMTLRAFVAQSFLTYLPVLYSQKGFTLTSIGIMVALFTIAGAISGLVAGHLSDRIGFKKIFISAHLLTTPCMYLLLFQPDNWIYVNIFLTGFFVMATLPLGVALAQKLAPGGKSMASSLMMGLAYGAGGLLTPLTGKLADNFSIIPVLSALASIPLMSIVFIYYLFQLDLVPTKK